MQILAEVDGIGNSCDDEPSERVRVDYFFPLRIDLFGWVETYHDTSHDSPSRGFGGSPVVLATTSTNPTKGRRPSLSWLLGVVSDDAFLLF